MNSHLVAKDIIFLILTIIGTLLGAYIGGRKTLQAAEKSHQLQQIALEKKEIKLLKYALEAIHSEVSVWWELHMEDIGHEIETENRVLIISFTVSEDLSIIYDKNAFMITRIPEKSLQELIIKTYILRQDMLDCFLSHNNCIDKFHEIQVNKKSWEEFVPFETSLIRTLSYQEALQKAEHNLIDSTNALRKIHYAVKNSVEKLLPELRKKIDSLE